MRNKQSNDAGFTLIELLVVMIIIGILASIAIPVFISQRAKAVDAATKSDVSRLGKELAAYFVDGTGTIQPLDATTKTGFIVISDNATAPWSADLKLTKGTTLTPGTGKSLANPSSSANWCVSLTNDSGSTKTYNYSANGGLAAGTC